MCIQVGGNRSSCLCSRGVWELRWRQLLLQRKCQTRNIHMGRVVLHLWLPSFAFCCWDKHHDPKQPGVRRVSFTRWLWTWFSGKVTPELNSYKPCSLRNYLELDHVRILKRSTFSKEKWVPRIDLRHWGKKTGSQEKDEELVSCAHVLWRVRKRKVVIFIHWYGWKCRDSFYQ